MRKTAQIHPFLIVKVTDDLFVAQGDREVCGQGDSDECVLGQMSGRYIFTNPRR